MQKLKIKNWKDESVVFSIDSGDLFLLTAYNAELLRLMRNQTNEGLLIEMIIDDFKFEHQEAMSFLHGLQTEFRKISLID